MAKYNDRDERREYRRRRRIRNQILAYAALALILVLLGVGGLLGVRALQGAGPREAVAADIEAETEESGTPAGDGAEEDAPAGVIETPEDYVPEAG